VVALCENRVVDKSTITKSELIKRESDFYTPDEFNKILHKFLRKLNEPAAVA